MVNGASPGPVPACQARASNSRLTRSSWRTWPHRKLRRKVPKVDGALTVHPSAEATRVIILSPALARPGARPRSRCGQPVGAGPGAGRGWPQDQPGVVDQAVVIEGNLDAVGVVAWVASIGCSLFRGGFQYKNHYPRFRGAPFHPFIRPLITTPSVDSGLDVGSIYLHRKGRVHFP